jgi:hypothetical protein
MFSPYNSRYVSLRQVEVLTVASVCKNWMKQFPPLFFTVLFAPIFTSTYAVFKFVPIHLDSLSGLRCRTRGSRAPVGRAGSGWVGGRTTGRWLWDERGADPCGPWPPQQPPAGELWLLAPGVPPTTAECVSSRPPQQADAQFTDHSPVVGC